MSNRMVCSDTTTKKAASFLSTPLSEIVSLSQVPGVGPITLERLGRQSISTVSQLIGQFMLLGSDVEAMVSWLDTTCAVRRREGSVIAEALFAKTERMNIV